MALRGTVIYRMEAFAKMVLFVFSFVFLAFASSRYLESNVLAVLFIMIATLPLVFIKVLIKRFSAQLTMEVEQDRFSITTQKTGTTETYALPYAELDAYKIEKSGQKYYILSLYHAGKRICYPFPTKETVSNQPVDILESVHGAINEFNKRTVKQVELKLPFYNTSKGKLVITTFAVLILVGMVLNILYAPKMLPGTSLFAIGVLVQIAADRHSNRVLYRKLGNGEPIR
jgi:hypothetical protein